MEKLTGPKHNHLFTDLLKVAIFGLMLLLPFLCFLPTGFYYGFNEHATNETTTTINYKYQSNEVNTLDDLVEGNIYHLNIDNTTIDSYFDFTDGHLFDFDVLYTYNYNLDQYAINLDEILSNTNSGNPKINFSIEDGYLQIFVYLTDNDYFLHFSSENLLDENDFTMNFVIKINQISGLTNYSILSYTDYNVIESVDTNVQDTISNKMYLAWEGVWTSPLFNWTNTTPLNTGLNGFISIFGINQSSYIANCLIYLLSITAIYVVFDIVLGIFKWLTHLINK